MLAEQRAYGDLLRVDDVDVYRHLPHKVKSAYAWAVAKTSAKWLVKTDDDSVVRVDTLAHYLTTMYDATRPVVVGHIKRGSGVMRGGKWAELDYKKDTYPPWPQGSFGHVVSRPVAEYVATHKDTLFNYQGEDVSVGIWLDESPLKDQVVWKSTTHFANHGDCKDPNLWMIGHNIKTSTMKACFAQMDESAHVRKTRNTETFAGVRIARKETNGVQTCLTIGHTVGHTVHLRTCDANNRHQRFNVGPCSSDSDGLLVIPDAFAPAPFCPISAWTKGTDNNAKGPMMCFDLKGAQTQPGTPIIAWDCNGGWNQLFGLGTGAKNKPDVGSLFINIPYAGHPVSELCLDAEPPKNSAASAGVPVSAEECDGSFDQTFSVEPL